MNTNRDVMSGSDVSMPSGCEVGAATFHTPVSGVQPIHSSEPSATANMKSKLDDLRNRGMSKLRDVQYDVTNRSEVIRSNVKQKAMTTRRDLEEKLMTTRANVQQKYSETRAGVQQKYLATRAQAERTMSEQKMRMESSMRETPGKWVGIAAGSGLAIGMIGRFMHWRSHHRRHMPQLVVIETSC